MSWYFPKSTPREVDGGLQARSRRGDIGEEWWSQKFVEALESYGRSNRLSRGKRYARKGQVLEIDVSPGTVEAPVQGSRPDPYRVTIGGDALDDDQWEDVLEAMAGRAAFTASLLTGEMPPDVEEAFEDAGASLFPDSLADMHTSCTCPDSANPCKHIAAVLYILAEKFDDDPFLIFRWRGRPRDELLDELRRRRAGGSAKSQTADRTPIDEQNDDFWSSGDDLPPPPTDGRRDSADPHELLDRLGDPPHELTDLPDALRPLYRAMAGEDPDE
ncbi:MAG: SWIM zinc finger family protein [Bradymonadaceae bacterium]